MAEAVGGETLTFKMQTKSSVVKPGKNGRNTVIGDVIIGTLSWGEDGYAVRSGPWGKGALPTGTYTVQWAKLVEGYQGSNSVGAGMRFQDKSGLKTSVAIADEAGEKTRRDLTGFFVPIQPDFEEARSGFGIHPDGNVYGTQGCIGIDAQDATAFWKKVLKTPAKLRPAKLTVSGTPEIAGVISVTASAGANE